MGVRLDAAIAGLANGYEPACIRDKPACIGSAIGSAILPSEAKSG